MFPKAKTDAQTYTAKNPTIVMDNWISPTLDNVGNGNITVYGIPVSPGDAFALGSEGLQKNDRLRLFFADEANGKACVVYEQLEEICNS